MGSLKSLQQALRALENPTKAKSLSRFFKTGKGEYGEGDQFLGISVPEVRGVAKEYRDLDVLEIQKLLHSKIHEERMAALCLLIDQFEKGSAVEKKNIFDIYLKSTQFINNWDLVDMSAHQIVGSYMFEFGIDKKILRRLSESTLLWDRRIAMVATFAFIRKNEFEPTLLLAKRLLLDTHDLMHKAVGWMLREVGKRDEEVLRKFLDLYAPKMPRTMLRYSIEKFSEKHRKYYMRVH